MEAQQCPHYALLDCEDAEKWRGHEKICYSMLHEGARWSHFKCYASELPPLETLDQYTGVLISGGHYSAYEERPWIGELAAWLGEATRAHPRVKFLGVCFGCQILARGLGGEVGKNPSRSFVLKVEELRLSPALLADPAYVQALADISAEEGEAGATGQPVAAGRVAAGRGAADATGNSAAVGSGVETAAAGRGLEAAAAAQRAAVETQGTAGDALAAASGQKTQAGASGAAPTSSGSSGLIKLIQSHGDQVLRLPEGATCLAESDTACYELWAWGENVLAVQGHAELTAELVMEKIHPAIAAAGRLTRGEAAASAHSLATQKPDSQLVLRLMRRFMERGLACAARPSLTATTAAPAAAQPAATVVEAQPTEELTDRPSRTAGTGATSHVGATAGVAAAAAEVAGAVPASKSDAGAGVEDAERALCMLGLGLEAELGRGPLEARLLQECNASAEDHYRHMGRVVAQASKVLQAVQEQQAALEPALGAISALEAQVSQLEGVMAHMEATATRLQHSLETLHRQPLGVL